MRADCLSIADHPVVDTPNIDQLAREGVRFKNAYAATPSCVPARASVLTGKSQSSTGRVGYQDRVPWTYTETMPEEFAKAGYHTQAIGKMHVYPTRSLCGFHNVLLHDGYMHYNRNQKNPIGESFGAVDDYLSWLREKAGSHVDLPDLGLDCNASTVARPWHLAEELHPTNWVTTQSIDFLRRRDPTKPFFLKMSYVRPHPPFDPPQVYWDMYRDLEMPDSPVGDWAMEADPHQEGYNPITDKGIVPKRRLDQAKAAYYALITQIDHQIGRFLMAMEEYGVRNNTVILFVSDHGELLGDHHLFRKTLPYEGSTNIPFILSDRGGYLRAKQTKTVEEVVELRDIMPTLLDAAGIEIPDAVDGKSVLPLIRKEEVVWRDYIHGEHTYGDKSSHYITNGKEKYIWFSQTGVEQFFDLEEDPEELRDLGQEEVAQDRIRIRREQLIASLVGREEGYTDGKQLIVGRRANPTLTHAFPQK